MSLNLKFILLKKTFDKVNRNFLWYKLLNKLNPTILKSLINYYNDSTAFIQNNNEYSNTYIRDNDWCQTSPLSPRLFAIYMEELTTEVETLNSGADLYNIIIYILLYADDILSLSNTKNSLQKML